MSNIKVYNSQSLFDIAIQEDGSFLAFEWAFENGLSVTDELIPGQELKAPKSIYRNADVANYFNDKNQKLTTALSKSIIDELIPEIGIGSMKIGKTFIVK